MMAQHSASVRPWYKRAPAVVVAVVLVVALGVAVGAAVTRPTPSSGGAVKSSTAISTPTTTTQPLPPPTTTTTVPPPPPTTTTTQPPAAQVTFSCTGSLYQAPTDLGPRTESISYSIQGRGGGGENDMGGDYTLPWHVTLPLPIWTWSAGLKASVTPDDSISCSVSTTVSGQTVTDTETAADAGGAYPLVCFNNPQDNSLSGGAKACGFSMDANGNTHNASG
jgi:hypothetical protein